MKNITEVGITKEKRPIKVVQFGEGNFLRGFADYMIDILNEKTDFCGGIAVVKPIEFGSLEAFAEQDCLYTVLLRGIADGKEKIEQRVITSCEKALSCVDEYEEYCNLAEIDTLRFVISNTTESGIVYNGRDNLNDCPPESFPGKLTKFLYHRYKYFSGDTAKGLIILPVELIDNNGSELYRIVKMISSDWKLEKEFDIWLDTACIFASTLVDRIITGYPYDEAEKIFERLGYKDKLLVTGEPFALWVIEATGNIRDELPLDKANLPVIFTDNQKPYKERKVRILNGAHTSFVPISFLSGNDFVGQSMKDPLIKRYIRDTIFKEIIPTLSLPKTELRDFADAVTDRFENPYINHSLLAISLNGVSKWKVRCLPSLLKYMETKKKMPERLLFSLAALIAFYNGIEIRDGTLIGNRNGEEYAIRDDDKVLAFFASSEGLSADELVMKFLSGGDLIGMDGKTAETISGKVAEYLNEIRSNGMRAALVKCL